VTGTESEHHRDHSTANTFSALHDGDSQIATPRPAPHEPSARSTTPLLSQSYWHAPRADAPDMDNMKSVFGCRVPFAGASEAVPTEIIGIRDRAGRQSNNDVLVRHIVGRIVRIVRRIVRVRHDVIVCWQIGMQCS
jgi:hypothetical protein